jgi:5,10-methylenetetrahydromethanopterin reductase
MYEADPALLDSMDGGPEWRAAVEAFPERERHLHTHEQHFVAMTGRDRASVTGELIGATTWTGTREELRARLDGVAAGGVSEFMYAPMGSDVARELEAFRSLF